MKLEGRITKNALWIMAGRLAHKLPVFVTGVLAARYLGPGDYGRLQYAAAYLTFFASLASLGLQNVILMDLVEEPAQAGVSVGSAVLLRLAVSLLSALMMVGLVFLADGDEPLTVLLAALWALSLIPRAADTWKQWFQWRLQSKYAAGATAVSGLLACGYQILLMALHAPVQWFALGGVVEFSIQVALLYGAYRRQGGGKLSFSAKKAWALLRRGRGFFLSGLMVSVYAATDKLMLGRMLSKETVACYALAVSLCGSWGFIAEAVIASVSPQILRSYRQDREAFLKKNRQLYALVFYGALAASCIVCLAAKPLVKILYGEGYDAAAQVLRIVVWYTGFSYLGGARDAWAVCEDAQKYLKYVYAAAAVLNVALNGVLIPLWGGVGAAAASLVTQIAAAVVIPACIPALRPNVKLMLEAIRLKDL